MDEALDIGTSVSHAWAAIRRFAPILWVGGVLRSCTRGGGGGGGDTSSNGRSSSSDVRDYLPDGDTLRHAGARLDSAWRAHGLPDPVRLLHGEVGAAELLVWAAIAFGVVLVLLVSMLFRAWVVAGWLRLHREILVDGTARFGTLFGAVDCLGPMFLWSMFQMLAVLALLGGVAVPVGALVYLGDGLPPLVVGGVAIVLGLAAAGVGVYFALGMIFGDHFIALDGASPSEALAGSFDLVSGSRLHLIVWNVVVGLVGALFMAAGLLACCVGAFVTIPLGQVFGDLGLTEGYLLLTRTQDETDRWASRSWIG